jgi:phosphohistidine phosphatase
MPRLLLLRHAKSSWDDAGLADIDRPLTPRGERGAALVGEAMRDRGYLPDHILCSPAKRTRQTLDAIIPFLGEKLQIAIEDDLYHPPIKDYRAIIAKRAGDAKTLLVIGHNPKLQATALLLTGWGDDDLADTMAKKYPTAALAVIDFAAKAWPSLPEHSGRIVDFVRPRDLKGGADLDDD